MKYLSKLILFFCVTIVFASCDKVNDLPYYGNGTGAVLSSSVTTVAPAPADSLTDVVTFSWTSPEYSIDSSNVKYVIEIDSAGRNFSNAVTRTVSGALSTTFTAKDFNTILLGFGFSFNVPYDIEARVTSSYANNNEQITSNTIKLTATPYKIPPKIALPTSGSLFLVGDATEGGWNNPVPVPSQEFVKIDETTYGGIFQLNGAKQYLILPVNGDWSHKYAVANNSITGLSAGGDFGYDLSDNFPGPETSGLYKIIVDFQTGKFTVTPYAGVLPTNLYIVGDATAGGWNNPVPVPSQQLTRLNSSVWQTTISLEGGKQYLLLPVNGDWSHKFAVEDNSITNLWSGGEFGYDLNANFPGPPTSGTYKITVNFLNNSFSVTP